VTWRSFAKPFPVTSEDGNHNMRTFFSSFARRAGWLFLVIGTACYGQYKQPVLLGMDARESRAGHAEFYLLGQYWHAESTSSHNVTVPTTAGPTATGDLGFRFDDTGIFGIGLGYNINKYLEVTGEFSFGYPNYTVSFLGSSLSGEAFMHSGNFNLEYHILPGKFTPFISGGIGYLYVDSQVPSGPPSAYCFWDYWWGYTCTGSTPTYHNTLLNLNAAAGVRWDIGEMFFLKASVGGGWANVHNSADWLQTIQITAAAGWRF
jgi:Outer membrane protein beta-barrel domain